MREKKNYTAEEAELRIEKAVNGALIGLVSSMIKSIEDGEILCVEQMQGVIEKVLYKKLLPDALRVGVERELIMETFARQGFKPKQF